MFSHTDKGIQFKVKFVTLEEGQCTSSPYWKPAQSCLGFGSAQHLQDGSQEGHKRLCVCLCFPLEWTSQALQQPQAEPRTDFQLWLRKGGDKLSLMLTFAHFFHQSALSPFHYLRAAEEHMLVQHKWLSKRKGHSERSLGSRENLGFLSSALVRAKHSPCLVLQPCCWCSELLASRAVPWGHTRGIWGVTAV